MTSCEVWVADCKGVHPPSEWFPDAEIRRLAGFTDPTSRQASQAAQALLRVVLARRLVTTPGKVPLLRHCPRCDSRQHGPLLVPGSNLSVSVAHAGTLVVAAVSDADAVGVDVECIPPPGQQLPATLLDLALSPSEKSLLRALPEPERGPAFRQWWTRKEAVLKASGEGILGPLHEVQAMQRGRSGFHVQWPAGSVGRPYSITDLDLRGHDAVGSVCVSGDAPTMAVPDGDMALREGLHQWEGSGHARDARAWR